MSDTTCGIVIVRKGKVVTCGNRTSHVLVVRGDYLIGICPRHDKRLQRAFPDLPA